MLEHVLNGFSSEMEKLAATRVAKEYAKRILQRFIN